MVGNIRAYKNSDFKEICSWWLSSTKQEPKDGMMIENGTFILEVENVPALCVTILLTQSKEMSYIFAFIKNPIFKDINLEYYGKQLWDHCCNYAKEQGYKRVLCFADIPELKEKYKRFGFKKTLDGLSSFVREI